MDGLMPVVMPAQELMRRLERRLGSSSCFELTGVDFTDLRQAMRFKSSGEQDRCIDSVRRGAEEIARLLQEAAQSGQLFRLARVS
jgi:hypothetical protein